MTIEELEMLTNTANWFSKLGHFHPTEKTLALRTLEAWRTENIATDTYHEKIANEMEWLPSEPSQPDPIHGTHLREIAESLGLTTELKSLSLKAYKDTLISLRNIADQPLLKIGPHDLNNAAKKSAAYSARIAAMEICLNQPGLWCEIIKLFAQGYLPCGLMPNGKLVVF